MEKELEDHKETEINQYEITGVKVVSRAVKSFQKWNIIIIERTQFNLNFYIDRSIDLDWFINNKELLSKIVDKHEQVACLEENSKRIKILIEEKGKQIYEWLKEAKVDFENDKYSTEGKTEEEFIKVLLENLVNEPWIEDNYINDKYEIESLSYSCDIANKVKVFCRFEKSNDSYELGEFYIDYIG